MMNTAGMMAAGMMAAAGSGGSPAQPPASGGLCDEIQTDDTRDTARVYLAGTDVTGCVTSRDDLDYYELETPASDAAGGYYIASLSIAPDANLGAEVYCSSDNSRIFAVNESGNGETEHFYWSAAPGQKYRVVVKADTAPRAPAQYTLRVAYETLPDTREPDDTRERAKRVALGEVADGYFFAGYTTNTIDQTQFEDWFVFDATPGMVTIKVDEVATDIDAAVQLWTEAGEKIGSQASSSNVGASVMVQRTISAAGLHYVRLGIATSNGTRLGYGEKEGVSDHFTRPYKITITQP